MLKQQIRKIYKERRLALADSERAKLDDRLLIRFQQVALPPSATLLSFWPMAHMGEFNTFPCADFLAFRMPGLQIAYPKVSLLTGDMRAVAVNDDTDYKENAYGIWEPAAGELIRPDLLDLIFVPLLAFDLRGNRVGYGKGFYDRFLKTCRDSSVKIGFSYFDPVSRIGDADEFDVPLTIGITPNRIYEF
ncbi:MAG: 5-formyltetrahydrofolate cyclo-ligase [Puia sp.]|nr:5-formyltetrahydrofolate cyclo-ligase [Puia sp.]